MDELVRIPGFDWLNGPAGQQLGKGPESMRDFAAVPVSRAMIMQDRQVLRLVRNCLAHGSFKPENAD
ncbi:MAG: hypothetical protein IIC61_09055 [Proteobacteria bacterium]|nr:hypothetical protein [Pseudomonadota bacterium]